MSSGMTVQVVGHETGKEDKNTWTKLMVLNTRGRFHVKFHGAKAEKLTRDLLSTLSEGETIGTKRLFIELFGEFTSFTRPGSDYKVRYFKADDYKVINGPSLELARLRGEALQALQQAETLRAAGAFAQAYKVMATYTAELAQFPLDLSELEVDDALLGRVSDEEYNPEASAAAHYERQDAMAQSEAEAETNDEDIPVGEAPDDLDELILSASSSDIVDEIPESDGFHVSDDDEPIQGDDDFSSTDGDEIPSVENEVVADDVAPPESARPASRPFSRFSRR